MQFLAPEQGKRKTKFVSKSVFRFPNAWKTVGPLVNLQSVQLLPFTMFFIFEKRKTEFDTDFRFYRARKTNGPLIHALNSYFERLNSYFESLNSYFESLNSYFESLNSYFESLNSYFESLNSYFESLNSYFESLNSYFETVADTGGGGGGYQITVPNITICVV